MRKLTIAFSVALALLLILSSTALAAPPEKAEVIIGFDRPPGQSEEGLVRGFGGEIKYTYNIVPAIAASIPETAIQGLLRNPRVTGIAPNIIFHAIGDGEYPWGVLQIGADDVHNSGNEGNAVKVAVIDTGIDYRHPELKAVYAGGYDFVNGDPNPMDDNGHGTHVAGTIAAALNGEGVAGVAPKVELYALKVLDRNGSGNLFNVIAALDWACGDNPDGIVVQITNNSYGSPVDDGLGLLQSAFDLSYHNDYGEEWNLLHVAAAGNSGTGDITIDNVEYPARYDSVIAVAAIDQGNHRASFSSTGPAVELAAPGVDILSTYLHRSYAWGSGTSMASPHVAGTAALVMAAYPNWTNIEVREQLQDTADDLGDAGRDNLYGCGLVDADEAAASTNIPPSVAITEPVEGEIISGTYRVKVSALDSDGTIDKVELSIDSTAYADITANLDGAFYYYDWDTTMGADGPHTLDAKSTDDLGATASSGQVVVTIDNLVGPVQTMHVKSLDMTLKKAGINTSALATVTIINTDGMPVAGATVSGQWSNATNNTDYGVTDSNGQITLQSDNVKRTPSGTVFTFTVNNVDLSGWNYDPAKNLETSDSVETP
jgi:subtilisin